MEIHQLIPIAAKIDLVGQYAGGGLVGSRLACDPLRGIIEDGLIKVIFEFVGVLSDSNFELSMGIRIPFFFTEKTFITLEDCIELIRLGSVHLTKVGNAIISQPSDNPNDSFIYFSAPDLESVSLQMNTFLLEMNEHGYYEKEPEK